MTAAGPFGLPQVGLIGALLGGLLALLSPCSALLLPSFFAYSFGGASRLAGRTAVFYVGLIAVLVPLGAGVGAVGALLTRYRTTVTTIGGVVMIAIGIAIVLGRGFTVPGASRAMGRITAPRHDRDPGRHGRRGSGGPRQHGLGAGSALSVLALGALYGLAGFCAGPLLGAVLTVAAAGGSPFYGGALMAVYSLGMAAPLFALALVWDRWRIGERRWLRGRPIRLGPIRTHTTSLVTGGLFAAIGVLFVATAGTASLGGLLSVHAEYDLQVWVTDIASTVTDVTVLFVAASALAVLLAARAVVRSRAERRDRERRRPDSHAERAGGPVEAAGGPVEAARR